MAGTGGDAHGLGLRAGLTDELAALGEGLAGARILAQHSGVWLAAPADGSEPRLVHARGKLRRAEGGPPVAGDWVALDEAGAIAAVLERRGVVVRRAAGTAGGAQVLAANVEIALVVEPLPEPNARRVERIVALASSGGVEPALVLTKADLSDSPGDAAARMRRDLGLADGIAVSAPRGEGVEAVRSLLRPGSTAVLLGPSGAGKSTLVNALAGEDVQLTQPVRAADGRGRHTTVVRELVALPGGRLVLDTPGIREAGLWEGTGETFDDIEELAAGCRFSDCAHAGEPGCAVAEGVSPERLAAWHKLRREQEWVDDRRAASRAREEAGRAYRNIGREARRAKGADED